MARYALRNQDKIRERLGAGAVESLLAALSSCTPAEGPPRGGYPTLEFYSDAGERHRFAVVGGLYDVKVLAYVGTEKAN